MDYKTIKPYIDKGLIIENKHPENPDVRLFNYTAECQFSASWDDITKQCRGLVMNIVTGEILARPFPKFFNYQEHPCKGWPVPASEPMITEKLDGSLGILYVMGGKPYVTTRGSFTSDQAKWATEWYRNSWLQPTDGVTDLFEVIYPENKIVLNYDFSGLVHLASIDIKTGKQVNHDLPIRKAEKIPNNSFEKLMEMDSENKEGFVLYFPSEDVRIKIKFPEYVRLHKIITGTSEKGIWEMMSTGSSLRDLLKRVPDEVYDWVKRVQGGLEDKFREIKKESMEVYSRTLSMTSRKEKALFISSHVEYPGVVFAMLDNKNSDNVIWKIIKPIGHKPFKGHEIDIDEGTPCFGEND